MRGGYAVALMVVLSACGAAPIGNGSESKPMPTPTYKPIDGFGDIKFGASFEEMIGSLNASLFNAYGVKECYRDLPIRGCSLHGASDDTVYEMRGGIPYSLDLSFNRLSKLTDIGLEYKREGGIKGPQCIDIFARTIDWVAADYGPMSYRRESGSDGRDPNVIAKTPGGTTYSYGKADESGSFVSRFIKSQSVREEKRRVDGKDIYSTLNRNIYILMTYIVVSAKPICSVMVQFREPDHVERYIYSAADDSGDDAAE